MIDNIVAPKEATILSNGRYTTKSNWKLGLMLLLGSMVLESGSTLNTAGTDVGTGSDKMRLLVPVEPLDSIGSNGTTGPDGTPGSNGTTRSYKTTKFNGITGSDETTGSQGTSGSNGTLCPMEPVSPIQVEPCVQWNQ